ncbi:MULTISPECIES: nicotinate-nucleotide adenylyltransferase [unclassified Arsenophonus]|uniref:nicotinate-nucleotide adenylyltransferase n=1 Tax=unclassified Arsenophonus TaxID=2627083 RepID=UPI00285AD951|nr:nicotinate-nucleotide adenylyltransferase [Arsenophonus sp.]MDR5610823.1 nicotinate-nucleotide adenylyltransferase [Arsenophonus sp.]MDR5614608.1 nicotinate-nucleotide adenylyltransferase [Arsenophonus sp.]
MTQQTKQTANSKSIQALFGGTFDPIHYGHLLPVEALAKQVGLQRVVLLPNHVPPHRPQPEATVQQRLAMIKLAIKNNPLFSIDTRELKRKTPSYTVETLLSFRQQIGRQKPLAFIIGQDSLLSINTWFDWQKILDLCHLLVCARPGYSTYFSTPSMQQWLKNHQVHEPEILSHKPCGAIYLADTPLLNISATEIRERKRDRKSCKDILPPAVLRYIDKHHLYQNCS